MIKDLAYYENLIRTTILEQLPQQDYDVFLFGSRAADSYKKWSDFDVGILGKNGQKVSATAKFDIQDNLDKLNVPFIVELVDFGTVSENFKKVALRKTTSWTA